MLQIYKKDNTNFENNGDYPLLPYNARLKVSLNGICEVEMEHPYDQEGRWEYITEESVISGPTPWSNKQLFRIYNVIKDMFGIKIYARHIFFDLVNYVLIDSRPTLNNGQEALDILLTNTPFIGNSNISTISTAYYIRKNIIEALTSDEQAYLNRWGGEIYWDNFTVTINSKIGGDYGVSVEYGKNLTGAEEEISTDNVVTRIIPVGYNGIMLDGSTPWVDSPNINKYPVIKQRVIKFDDVKLKENPQDEEGFNTLAEARAELVNRCNELFEGGIDSPSINLKVSMETLSDKLEYKGYEVLEDVQLGDIVKCKNTNIGIDTTARCISYEWDMLMLKYISIELGTPLDDYFSKQNDISYKAAQVINDNGTVKAQTLEGTINALQTKFKAMKDIAQTQHVRAMLYEDLDPNSPTFGATCIGTMGFQISDKRTADGRDWDWRTFGTGKGFTADEIVAGVLRAITLQSLDGSCTINLNNGEINVSKGSITGPNMLIDLDQGKIYCNGVDSSGKPQEINIQDGEISSENGIWIEAKTGVSMNNWVSTGGGMGLNSVSCYDWGVSLASISNRISLIGDTEIIGNFVTSGNKNCMQPTTNFGNRLFYSVEDGKSFLTYTEEELQSVDEIKEKKIMFNEIYKECVNLETSYIVEIHKVGWGDYRIKEQTKDYFVIESDRTDFSFKYTIKAKRKGYEDVNMNVYENKEVVR